MKEVYTEIALPYDEPEISAVRIPRSLLHTIYTLPDVSPVASVETAVASALQNPIESACLRELVDSSQRIAIIVDDITRPTPTAAILPSILAELEEAHIAREQIVIVMALGSHRSMSEEELDIKLSEEVRKQYRVTQSHFDDPENLVLLGQSEDGVDIYIDKEVAEADFTIGLGSIVPHGAVGWSGGGKIIYPGVAGESTVAYFHYTHGLTEANLTGLDETVVRTRLEAWVKVVGLDFIVNAVLTPDGGVYHIVAGHYIAAHRAGVMKAHEAYTRNYSRQDDIVISISHPHDVDFWQAGKGFYAAESLVKDGGSIIVATPCPEGIGLHHLYPERIGRDDNVELIHQIIEGGQMPEDPISLAPAAMVSKIRKRINLHIVSPGLDPQEMQKAFITSHPTLQAGLDYLIGQYENPSVSVVLSAELCFRETIRKG
jgi:nickel-dependent lactate racemase